VQACSRLVLVIDNLVDILSSRRHTMAAADVYVQRCEPITSPRDTHSYLSLLRELASAGRVSGQLKTRRRKVLNRQPTQIELDSCIAGFVNRRLLRLLFFCRGSTAVKLYSPISYLTEPSRRSRRACLRLDGCLRDFARCYILFSATFLTVTASLVR